MPKAIPESHRDLLTGKNFANLATVMSDGTPQVTPVWVDFDGKDVLINTVDGRVKAKNLDRDPNVALTVMDSANSYRYVQVRGKVEEKTRDGAEDHIDKLAKRYMGVDSYPNRNGKDRRVIYKIRPEHVQTMG